jgi:hypothetical protein
MPALFPPWTNTASTLALAGLLATIAGVPTAFMVYVRTPFNTGEKYTVIQPVEFDHRHHVADDGIDCRYCHDEVSRGPFAGVPATAVCMGCHDQVWNQSPMLEPVRRAYFGGQPIAWNRVHHLPDFVYFNHSIHVTSGIGCATCHGRVDQMAKVYQVNTLQMKWCLDCHRDPEPNLRPRDQITSMTWTPPADPGARRALAARLAGEYGTRHLTNCTTCHR